LIQTETVRLLKRPYSAAFPVTGRLCSANIPFVSLVTHVKVTLCRMRVVHAASPGCSSALLSSCIPHPISENLFFRKQLAVPGPGKPRRAAGTTLGPGRPITLFDWRAALVIVKPEIFVRHRAAFGYSGARKPPSLAVQCCPKTCWNSAKRSVGRTQPGVRNGSLRN
jgi:hypothetical protein